MILSHSERTTPCANQDFCVRFKRAGALRRWMHPPQRNIFRSTGLIQALEWRSIRVPGIFSGPGTGGRITPTKLIPNGRKVSTGDLLVKFDRAAILDEERDAKAKIENFTHQLEEKNVLVKKHRRIWTRRRFSFARAR